jgi:hypothetical protein
MARNSEELLRLGAKLTTAVREGWRSRGGLSFDGEDYKVEYTMTSSSVLVRKSDGRRFEVEFDATIAEVFK